MDFSRSYILNIFIGVISIFALIIFIDVSNINLNPDKSTKKVVQVVNIEALKNKLLKRSFLVTPNIDEAQILSEMKINNLDDMYESAKIIKALGVKAVLIKGGHLNFADNKIHNLLLDEENKIHIII